MKGTAKRFTEFWVSKGSAFEKFKEAPLLDNKIKSDMQDIAKTMELQFDVEPTSLITKMTTGAGFSQLKAVDWMVWTLAISPFVLRNILKPAYLRHWMLFVRAVRLIAVPAIKCRDIETADLLFQKFIEGTPKLYGKDMPVSNTHNMLHVKLDLHNYASLYASWLLPYKIPFISIIDRESFYLSFYLK
jgi:hypothetical protein